MPSPVNRIISFEGLWGSVESFDGRYLDVKLESTEAELCEVWKSMKSTTTPIFEIIWSNEVSLLLNAAMHVARSECPEKWKSFSRKQL